MPFYLQPFQDSTVRVMVLLFLVHILDQVNDNRKAFWVSSVGILSCTYPFLRKYIWPKSLASGKRSRTLIMLIAYVRRHRTSYQCVSTFTLAMIDIHRYQILLLSTVSVIPVMIAWIIPEAAKFDEVANSCGTTTISDIVTLTLDTWGFFGIFFLWWDFVNWSQALLECCTV